MVDAAQFFKKAKTGSFKLPRNKDGEFCAMNWDLTMFWRLVAYVALPLKPCKAT